MHVVITHTDFRVYWPARLRALHGLLRQHGGKLTVLEIAGKGSPYAFVGALEHEKAPWWHCLFPERGMEQLAPCRAARVLWRALDEADPDVVLAGAIAFPSGATALRWGVTRRRPVVIFDNARRADVPRSVFVNHVKRRLYRYASALLIPAPSHVPDFEFWGIPRAKLFFGLNVVDNDWFARRVDDRRARAAELRAALDVPARFLLGVGRQVPKKNWDGLLHAWGRCVESGAARDLELVLLGEGPEREHLMRIAREQQLQRVHFRPFVTQDELCSYYLLADALVLPSLFGETWGLVVNEAMAAGLPVLVSRSCGCAETLVTAENGWVFDPTAVDEIAFSIAALAAAEPALLKARGERSRAIVGEWSLDRFCQGALGAATFAFSHLVTLPRPSVVDRVLLRFWHGRYRPT